MIGKGEYRSIAIALLIALALIGIAVFAPILVGAQTGQIVPCDGPDCDFCSLATLAQRVLNFGIFLAVILSTALFAWAGWLFLANRSNPEQISRAKTIFFDVAVGLVIILAAWLIVDTFMKTLTDGKFGPWNEVCSVGAGRVQGSGAQDLPPSLFRN